MIANHTQIIARRRLYSAVRQVKCTYQKLFSNIIFEMNKIYRRKESAAQRHTLDSEKVQMSAYYVQAVNLKNLQNSLKIVKNNQNCE